MYCTYQHMAAAAALYESQLHNISACDRSSSLGKLTFIPRAAVGVLTPAEGEGGRGRVSGL